VLEGMAIGVGGDCDEQFPRDIFNVGGIWCAALKCVEILVSRLFISWEAEI